MKNQVICGDCLDVMCRFPPNTFDTVITDPPYELGFMGKSWDSTGIAYNPDLWRMVLRVLKPGGHLLSFGGSRTYHRMACAIEGAGFEIRDMIEWIYGSGFPKSLNIGKAVDKLQGNEREIVGMKSAGMGTGKSFGMLQSEGTNSDKSTPKEVEETKGTSAWEGYGTALKPAHEPICLARKPISEKTVAENCLKWDVGGLNIDGCRVGTNKNVPASPKKVDASLYTVSLPGNTGTSGWNPNIGRWPANLLLDEEAGRILDEQSGISGSTKCVRLNRKRKGFMLSGSENNIQEANAPDQYGDKGGASRFFYCAKASKKERGEGNFHPTCKPLALMEYLCKLTKTPTGGIVLDPFGGSGTTALACIKTGRDYVLIEKEPEYCEIANKRIGGLNGGADAMASSN